MNHDADRALVERLRAECDELSDCRDTLLIDAADALSRLLTENERLRVALISHSEANQLAANFDGEVMRSLQAEVEALRAANVRLQEALAADPVDQSREVEALRADKERLDWALRRLRDHGEIPLDVDGRTAIDAAREGK